VLLCTHDVRKYVFMDIFHFCIHYLCLCGYVCMYVCVHVCTYVLMYICTYLRTYIFLYLCMYVFVCIYNYVCMYVSVYVYMYNIYIYTIHTRMYIHTHEKTHEDLHIRITAHAYMQELTLAPHTAIQNAFVYFKYT
jgi:hypothetical protein